MILSTVPSPQIRNIERQHSLTVSELVLVGETACGGVLENKCIQRRRR